MATVIKAGVLKRNSNYFGGGSTLQTKTFNVASISNAQAVYVANPAIQYDISLPQYTGGVFSLNDPAAPQGADMGYQFQYNDGGDNRFQRYIVLGTTTTFPAAINDTAVESTVLATGTNYTLIG